MIQSRLLIVVVIVAVIVIAIVGFLAMRKRRSQKLRERFGPEYDRVVRGAGDVRRLGGGWEARPE